MTAFLYLFSYVRFCICILCPYICICDRVFVFDHDDVPEPRPSDAAQQRLHRVTAAVEGHRHLDPTNWPDDLSFRLPAGNWDDFNCFCRNLFLVNLTSIQKSDVEGAAGQFSIVSDC